MYFKFVYVILGNVYEHFIKCIRTFRKIDLILDKEFNKNFYTHRYVQYHITMYGCSNHKNNSDKVKLCESNLYEG
jgi:hypothetical protein